MCALKKMGIIVFLVVFGVGIVGCGSQSAEYGQADEKNPVSVFDRSWSLSWHLDVDEGDISDHDVATDDTGNTVVVWKQSAAGANSIWASVNDAGSQTQVQPQTIGTENTGAAYAPRVDMDQDGNAVAAWCQYDGSLFSVYVNMYDSGSGAWAGATEVDLDTGGHAFQPQLYMAGGNAVVVWYQHDGVRYSIFSSRYEAVSGTWGEPLAVENDDAGDAYYPELDGNSSGFVMAVWKQFDGEKYSVWANRYDLVAGTWGIAEVIENNNLNHANYPVVAVNSAGDAFVSWYMYEGSSYRIYGNRYDSKTATWGEAVPVEDVCEGDGYTPVVAIDDNSNVIVVWIEDNGAGYALNARRYDAEKSAWTNTVQLDSGESGDADSPRIAIDAEGNAVVVWQQFSVNCNIKASRYDVTTGTWGAMESLCDDIARDTDIHTEIADNSTVNAYDPIVVFDPSGRAVVIWRMSSPLGNCLMVSALS